VVLDTVPVSNECSRDAEGRTLVFGVQEDSRIVKIEAKEQSTHAKESQAPMTQRVDYKGRRGRKRKC
jgi:hypothetical protein